MSLRTEPTRFATLDGLRGLAVMGILLMNVTAFALPEGAYFNPAAYGSRGPADYAAWWITSVLVDGKMRGLFSLLFGASLLLVADRAGEAAARVHYARMAVLLGFGLVHNYLIWWGDILIHYAVIGSLAFAFRGLEARQLVKLGAVFFLLQLLVAGFLMGGMFQWQAQALAPGAPRALVDAWLDTRATIGIATPDRLAAQLAEYRGSYAGLLHVLTVEKGQDQLFLLFAGGAETLGLMLFGMAGLRSGFLTGAWPRAAYRQAMLWGYGLGVPATLLLSAVAASTGWDSLTTFALSYAAGLPFRPLVMLGHVGAALLWLANGEEEAGSRIGSGMTIRNRVIAAGRAAFTNYLGTSLLMAFLFYGWGLGLFGTVNRAALYLFVLAAWGIMLAWSAPWLRTHAYGPLEWLWRSIARGRVQSWRRGSAVPSP